MPRAVVLIDGEHYPPVVAEALVSLGREYEVVAAVFLGGTEKIKGDDLQEEAERLYGVPVVFGPSPTVSLLEAIERFAPAVIVDVSDEPVVGYAERFRLISHALSRSVSYAGSDFRFEPPELPRIACAPSLSIIGTAKRVGKTALSGFVARTLQSQRRGRQQAARVVIVAMGRGGPSEPEVIDGLGVELGASELLQWSRQGRHAASDHFEDAALSRVTTVGCRRCGGGLAGRPFVSNVAAGAEVANSLKPDLIVFEGSGAAIPPVATDSRVCVAGAHQPLDYVTGYLGSYRALISDAVVLTMAEEPLAGSGNVKEAMRGLAELVPEVPVLPVVFRPRPMDEVSGKKVAFFCTAPRALEEVLTSHLEAEHGCRVKLFSPNLSNRRVLREDFGRPEMAEVELVLTEIKAAAIDVVAEEAERRGIPVSFVDNDPVEVAPAKAGDLEALSAYLADVARERFTESR
jgi:cyclic 2,3-diphosphoglycerate synthetase